MSRLKPVSLVTDRVAQPSPAVAFRIVILSEAGAHATAESKDPYSVTDCVAQPPSAVGTDCVARPPSAAAFRLVLLALLATCHSSLVTEVLGR